MHGTSSADEPNLADPACVGVPLTTYLRRYYHVLYLCVVAVAVSPSRYIPQIPGWGGAPTRAHLSVGGVCPDLVRVVAACCLLLLLLLLDGSSYIIYIYIAASSLSVSETSQHWVVLGV